MPLPKVKITTKKKSAVKKPVAAKTPVVPASSASANKHPKKATKKVKRRSSFDIARSFVELNFVLLLGPELTAKEAKKAQKRARKLERRAIRERHRLRRAILSTLVLLGLCVAAASIWWTTSLRPVDENDTIVRRFVVAKGASTEEVATALQKAGFIRNALAYQIYVRLNNSTIQAGSHSLSSSYSTPEIARKLEAADVSEIDVQVPPGLTLKQLRSTWKKYGYADADIDAAYAATYTGNILGTRPEGASLEGYIFPDTYRVYSNAKLETIIQKALDQFELVAAQNDLQSAFAAQGLTFFEGVTMASLITKEVPGSEDQKLVASVFYNRLKSDISLGSDPTFKYAYSQGLCDTNSYLCDSEYNTRLYKGLPPGPIANPTLSALQATADPAVTDYYYFVSGDGIYKNQNFFAKTLEEHTANIRAYCKELCR